MIEKSYKRGRMPRHPRVWWSRLKVKWPLLFWLAAVVLAWFLFTHGGQSQPLTGLVDVVRETASPLETARLSAIHVQVGDAVEAGQLLAVMDTALLDAEMAVEELQLERQFEQAVQRMETDLHNATMQRARDEAELAALDHEVKRLDELLQRRLIDAQLVTNLRVQQQALRRAVELHPETIEYLERQLEEAAALKRKAQMSLGAKAESRSETLAAVASDVAGIAPRISLLQRRRENCGLRARQAGVVSRIDKEPGEVVQAGEAVLSMVVEGSQHIIGFLPEWSAYDLRVGQTATLTSPTGRRVSKTATVTALGPEILGLPGRVSAVPGQTMRGRRVVLVPDGPCDFLPGESVSIQVEPPWWEDLPHWASRLRSALPGGS